ncbi:MlaD family protein [Methylocella tundrae]|uniref:Mammalian cell entry protein n=1 Tax=Methylocella tundrae TaxID=227605 RepID=A0A4V6YUJ3_METTU|nr:MlaD family protein [Methylocella tundrae]WPP03650.1 MlaD family protein [Methylocella tundrae]VFU09779.1 Mammalian cell entry protein [Methylocella tundrae]
METRANYALIGVFTLAVIASAFGFVLWVSGGDKPGAERAYKIVFAGSVSGLLRGAPVLFNGVRVGDVTNVDFMPNDPSHVYAIVEVDGRVPIHTDTKARLESTGLTGVASVELSGGTEAAPKLQSGPDGGPPVIMAERSDFQDLIESARKIAGQATEFLDRTNKVLDDNTGSITASVKNIQKFSDALASNSDGIKDFMSSIADVGKAIKPLTVKLEALSSDADNVVKAVDPAQVKTIISDFAAMSGKLNSAADKVDGVLTNLNGFLATGDNKGVFAEVAATAKSIRKLADDIDSRWKDIGANLTRFTGSGLREYEALAVDGRKTLDQVNQAIRSIEQNPQQFIFGRKQQIPEYTGAR